jgi:hypothetical protein
MLKPKSSQSSGCTHIHQTSRKFKQTLSACQKADGSCLMGQDRKGVPMVEFMQQGTTITSEEYCETLKKKLLKAIQNKRRGMLKSGVALLRDNALPHTADRTRTLLEHFNWELFDHRPYTTDLAPSDYHLFTYLKNWLRSQRFKNNEQFMEGIKT